MAGIYNKICPICQKEFIAHSHNAIYCSEECKRITYKRYRNKEKYGNEEGTKVCLKCGETFTPHENGYTRRYCFNCVPEETYEHGGAGVRKLIKLWAVEYKGGKCQCCGYSNCIEALDFHHLNEAEKDFIISSRNVTTYWPEVKEELNKCILVCANCHREIHAKYRKVD